MTIAGLVDVPRRLLIGIVRAYRLLLSPWLGSSCRFTPTCSAYTLEALERYGAFSGTYLGARRIARCHPWCPGGFDPVPESAHRFSARRPGAVADRRTQSHSPMDSSAS